MQRKRACPVLTAVKLTGDRGLARVRRSFLASVAFFLVAARYSRSLLAAYPNFAAELFPTLAAEDVFLKVEQLGAKKEVKDRLNFMGEDARKEHVERVLGREKASRILREL